MTGPETRTQLCAALARDGGASSDFDLNPGTVLPEGRKLREAGVLIAVEAFDICGVDISVMVQIHPQATHGMDGDAVICGPAGIIGVIHIAAFSGDDFAGNLFDGGHDAAPRVEEEGVLSW